MMSARNDPLPEWHIWTDRDDRICVQEYHTLQEIPVSQAEAMLNEHAELVSALKLARPYIAKMVADGVQTALSPSVALRRIDILLTRIEGGTP